MLWIAIAAINTKESLQCAIIQRHIGQATHIHDIINVRVCRVKTDKTIDGSLSKWQIGVFVVGVDEI